MKKFTLIALIALIGATNIFAQAPKSFKYQAVVRDNTGSIIASQPVSFRIGIIQDSITGSLIYSETHNSTTNQFGMAVLKIGDGSVEFGVFENINWGTTAHFLKLELDETGNTNYQFMGTSELLSVPYSINSGSLTLTSPSGANYEVSVDDNGNLITTCTPMPSTANAGADQDSVCFPAILAANTPLYGEGLWSVINGTGGSFSDETDPTSEFYGIAGNAYTLQWTISNACGFTEDDMDISFKVGDLFVDAGADQTDVCTPTNLVGNTPTNGTGLWTIESGTGGNIAEPSNPESGFSGIPGNLYTLRWTITTACQSGFDEINISFEATPTIADAGSDQTDVCSPTNLAGNTPTNGTGLWTIENGTGGSITEPSNPTSEFTGTAGSSYVLRWTITTACDNSFDEVNISFGAAPTIAVAGTDQDNVIGTATLTANTPTSGTGHWTIISGAGGNIAEPSNSTSEFTGIADSTYTLRWTISTVCDNSYDEVNINFAWVCGLTLTDGRDAQAYGTIQIGIQCWMQENLNIGTMISGGSNQTDNGVLEKYCYDNNIGNCDTYGGLYQWDEMMGYVTTEGAQGICPAGWHLPTDAEWCVLENEVDAGTVSCSTTGWRGTDGGTNLKLGGTSGFEALAGGRRGQNGVFGYMDSIYYFWTSTFNNTARQLQTGFPTIYRHENISGGYGFNLRCLKD